MPLLRIQTNIDVPEERRRGFLQSTSASVADLLGKPETYVMVSLEVNRDMLFAGDNAPLAYLELKSIDLPAAQTKGLAASLCDLLAEQLDISQDRVYIEFANAARHMWGWNGSTFER